MNFVRNLIDVSYLSNRPLSDTRTQAPATTLLDALSNLVHKNPLAVLSKWSTQRAFIDAYEHPQSIDDRAGVFIAGLQILSSLPPDSAPARTLANSTIHTLYNTVPHPPATLLGPAHASRAADGAGNSIQDPDCGRAGTPYARSVQSAQAVPRSALPDPALVFDTLLAGPHRPHPGGNAGFTFAFASIVTHSLFRTNHDDWNINDTSSYLDLSPLYGHDQAAQDTVRDRAQGRGLLYPDTFAEERLLFLPPAPCALLVLFCRNHNYIAETLLKINERGTWRDPPPADPVLRRKQDDDIFGVARLVNCGHFMALILGDYAAGFLGLSEGTFWDIKAFNPIKLPDGDSLPRGRGNHVSVEFNMMYRWHATLSAPDIAWTETAFARAFPDKPFARLEPADFGAALGYMARHVAREPRERVFGGLARSRTTHRFPDDGLAAILQDATAHAGGAYGARGTPGVLRVIEVLGIEQARTWGVCGMNEFRRFLGLKEYKTFKEWNSNESVAAAAERLYGHIDNLELYTGLQAEETMPVTNGSRLAAGYSTTRAVLGDAIAMIRGDRFYTTDYTPGNLTAWGFQDCLRDPHNGGFGGEMPKLLMRHLPRHYPYNSVYSLFPFFTPKHMLVSLTRQRLAARYTFHRPTRDWRAPPVVLNTFAGIRAAFGAGAGAFRGVYDVAAEGAAGRAWGAGVLVLGKAGDVRIDGERSLALGALYPGAGGVGGCAEFVVNMEKMIGERSWRYDGVPGRYVDIVDVVNRVCVRWAAEHLCGLPLKTAQNPKGLFTELEVDNMFKTLFRLVFLSIDDPEHGFSLRHSAEKATGVLQTLIAKAITDVQRAPTLNPVKALFNAVAALIWPSPVQACDAFIRKVAQPGMSQTDVLTAILGFAVTSSVNYAHAAVLVVDFYLDGKRDRERLALRALVARHDTASDELLRGYVREALRLNPPCTGLYRDVIADVEIPQGAGRPPVQVTKGDRIWASFKNAALNPEDFPDPLAVDPTRPQGVYHFPGSDFQTTTGGEFVEQIAAQVVRAVFGLEGLARAKGDAGRLVGFKRTVNETETNVFVTPEGTTSPFPGPMHIVYANN